MWDVISTAIGTLLAGGATGILGSLLQSYMGYKNRQLDIEQNKQNNAHDMDMLKLEIKGQIQIIEQERASQSDLIAGQVLQTSYEHDSRRYLPDGNTPTWIMVLMGIVDFLRGIVRPSLTVYMAVVVSFILSEVSTLLAQIKPHATAEMIMPFAEQILFMVLYLATTIFFWWFGQRPPANFAKAAR